MAKDQIVSTPNFGRRAPAPAPQGGPVAGPAKKPFNPVQFLREVRVEARKVTWTSWKETWITSVMVGIMVVMTAIFFFGVDWLMHLIIGAVLKLANAE
jgi:preprotein translocase subunit SecE